MAHLELAIENQKARIRSQAECHLAEAEEVIRARALAEEKLKEIGELNGTLTEQVGILHAKVGDLVIKHFELLYLNAMTNLPPNCRAL